MAELLADQRKEGESSKAIQACNDYLLMGPGRSLQKLHNIYSESRPEKPPTRHLRTLKEWSRCYDWQSRTAIYDTGITKENLEAARAARSAEYDKLMTALSTTYDALISVNREIIKRLGKTPKDISSKDLVRLTRVLSSQLDEQLTQQLVTNTKNEASWIHLRFFVLKRDGFRCRYCGRNPSEDGVKLQVDHIFPRSNGGSDDPNNLITSCVDCNLAKSDGVLEPELERFVREALKDG